MNLILLDHIQVHEMPTTSPFDLLYSLRQSFDIDYYKSENADVVDAGVDPLAHFILSGLAEGRAPSARTSASDVMQVLAAKLGRLPDRAVFEDVHQELLANTSSLGKIKWLARSGLSKLRPRQAKQDQTRAVGFKLPELANLSVINVFSGDGPTFKSKERAIEYVLKEGYRHLLPLDFHLIPDIQFVRAVYPEYAELGDEDAYRWWLEKGIRLGHFVCEAHALKHAGARTTSCMSAFPCDDYRSAYRDLPLDWSNEQLFLHFLNEGIREARFNFDMPANIVAVVEDVIEALAKTDPFKARHAAQRLIMRRHYTPNLAIIAARAALSNDDLLEVFQLLDRQNSQVPIEQYWIENLKAQATKRAEIQARANEYMRKARDIEYASVWAEREYQSFLRTSFEDARTRARRLADLGKFDPAMGVLESAVSDAYDSLQPYGFSMAPVPIEKYRAPLAKRSMRIGLLCDLFLPQCKLYRVDQKVEQLQAAGIEAEVFDFRTQVDTAIEQAGMFDAWIIYRVPAFFDCLRLVRCVNELGRPTIYEIDDLLFDAEHYPEPLSAFGGNISEKEHCGLRLSTPLTAGMAKVCSHGIASTETLAIEMAKLVRTGEVYVHRNALSAPHYAAVAAHKQASSQHDPSIVRVFYGSGTRAHKDFLEDVFFSAMDVVMSQRQNVEFHAVGHVNAKRLMSKYRNRVFESAAIWDAAAYWAKLGAADINTAILKKSLLTDAKSEIKWMEAGMFGIPSVVSGTATLMGAIEDGTSGLIANNREDWIKQLLRLVDDPDLRRSIGANAQQQVLKHYDLDKMSTNLGDHLTQLVWSETSVREAS